MLGAQRYELRPCKEHSLFTSTLHLQLRTATMDQDDTHISGEDTTPSNAEPIEGIALNDVYEYDDGNAESSPSSISEIGSLSSLASEKPLYKNIFCFLGSCEGLSHPDEEHTACVACGHDFTRDQFGLEEGAAKKPTKTGCGDAFHMSCIMQLVTMKTMQCEGMIHYSRKCPLCRVEWFPNPTSSHIALLNPDHDGVDQVSHLLSISLLRSLTSHSLASQLRLLLHSFELERLLHFITTVGKVFTTPMDTRWGACIPIGVWSPRRLSTIP